MSISLLHSNLVLRNLWFPFNQSPLTAKPKIFVQNASLSYISFSDIWHEQKCDTSKINNEIFLVQLEVATSHMNIIAGTHSSLTVGQPAASLSIRGRSQNKTYNPSQNTIAIHWSIKCILGTIDPFQNFLVRG